MSFCLLNTSVASNWVNKLLFFYRHIIASFCSGKGKREYMLLRVFLRVGIFDRCWNSVFYITSVQFIFVICHVSAMFLPLLFFLGTRQRWMLFYFGICVEFRTMYVVLVRMRFVSLISSVEGAGKCQKRV